MGQRKDEMMVWTAKQPRLLKREPALDLDLIALGADPVLTGVVPHPLDVPLGTGLDMTP